MIEVDFKDRIPTHAGRVKLTPVDGQPGFFTMERADEPTEPGTPIDKAALDSIIKSRLTGRYYVAWFTQEIISNQIGITSNPIPSSSWVYHSGGVIGNSGSWSVESSSVSGVGYYPGSIFDGRELSYWQSALESESWVKISMGTHIKFTKFIVNIEEHGKFSTLQLQGSNNGFDWDVLIGLMPGNNEYTIADPKEYLYYRLYFRSSSEVNTTVYEWQITEYDITTYRNNFVIDEFPTDRTDYQRFTIITPASLKTLGVISNTLNGEAIDTILQPNKYYELIKIVDKYYAFGK